MAIEFLCWFGLIAMAVMLVAAAYQDWRSRKCPKYVPDEWMVTKGTPE